MSLQSNPQSIIRIISLVLLAVAIRDTCFAGPMDEAKREPWTTSRVQGSPEPPLPFTTERAFAELKFDKCLDMASIPGTNRLFVLEQSGKIHSFVNKPDVKTAELVADLAKDIEGLKQTYAFVFHPDFAKNRLCYVCYLKAANLPDGTHIASFRVNDSDPPTIDPSSERTIITWPSGGHNGCCLKFGPDGYLYISAGDGTGPNPPDTARAGQDLSNLLSTIMRIDVDHRDRDRNYRIPPDNPFVDLKDARGEIWAYGFRNPWRMSFDRLTGALWVGDVGWELWELLDQVERGGNYGWSVMEGRQPTNPEWPRGPTPILPPTIDHPHSESSSITDGLTYYGRRLSELHGTHIYADYDTGKFWGFRYVNGKVTDHRELADTTHRVVGFGEDQDGEAYILDHTAGTLHRLVANPRRGNAVDFPRQLSATGLFTETAKLTSAPGVLAYSINAEPWSDYADAERLIAIPGESSINNSATPWKFPKDSVLVKTLSIELERGNPASRQRIETQILHFDGLDWQPYTYRWNESQNDASLVDALGEERLLTIKDPEGPGGQRIQAWRFSGRAECQRCHNKWSGPPLAFNTPQLHNEPGDESESQSQLDTFFSKRVFEKQVGPDKRSSLANPHDEAADLSIRARSYLQSNCAHCHRLHAGSAVLSKMHFDLPLEKTDMVGVRPSQGTFGIHAAEVIAPGEPFRSVLFYRMSKLGGGRMPHIGSEEVDHDGLELIYRWLKEMPERLVAENTNNPSRDHGDTLEQLKNSRTAPAELIDHLLGSTGGAMRLLRSIDERTLSQSTIALAIEKATQHEEVSVRDLFERFIPPAQRTKRLGTAVDAAGILAMTADSARGKKVFFATAGVQCKSCHRIHNEGEPVGPDLTTIGKKYSRAELLESILEPSKRIDPKFVTYLVETNDGRLLKGLLVKKDSKEVVLRDAQNKLLKISAADVEQLVAQKQSIMPELLLRDMTGQQVADLLAYLIELK